MIRRLSVYCLDTRNGVLQERIGLIPFYLYGVTGAGTDGYWYRPVRIFIHSSWFVWYDDHCHIHTHTQEALINVLTWCPASWCYFWREHERGKARPRPPDDCRQPADIECHFIGPIITWFLLNLPLNLFLNGTKSCEVCLELTATWLAHTLYCTHLIL